MRPVRYDGGNTVHVEDTLDASPSPLTPQAWCRRVLTTLHERSTLGSNGGDLPMLLAYFIELAPSPELFTDLLARCAADPRPEVADAARVLQRSWERRLSGAGVIAQPPLAEILRTLGALLDASSARGACLAMMPEAARVQPFGDQSIVDLDALEQHPKFAACTALRGQVPAHPGAEAPHEARLRGVGLVLDAKPSRSYEPAVMPSAIIVEGWAGHQRVFTAGNLAKLRAAAARQRQAGNEAR